MNRLKLQWEKLTIRLDAMSLRERAMVFAAGVGVVLFVTYTFALDPLLKRQRLLQEQMLQQNNQMTGIDLEVQAKVQAFATDPDAPVRAQLSDVRHQIDKGTQALLTMQKGLVAPEKIAPMLEKILHGNGKLKLIALRTLPVTGLNDAAAETGHHEPAAPAVPPSQGEAMLQTVAQAAQGGSTPTLAAPPPPTKPRELLYRHGVEIVLQGSYLDMISYMDALEALPAQLFWGRAELQAGQYPDARLKLTVYTLSLDQKWMQL